MENSSASIDWRSLLRDLVILVVGIMLSLTMNECRQNARAANDEERIMRQLIEDVAADTLVLTEMLNELEQLVELHDQLYTSDTIPTDLRYGIASSVLFLPFQPNRTAMLELSYSNRSGDIKRRNLVAEATALHETSYRQLIQVADLIGEYVIQDHLPFITDNLFYQDDSTFTPEEIKKLDAFINLDRFRQRINWLQIMWINQEITAKHALNAARELLRELEKSYVS